MRVGCVLLPTLGPGNLAAASVPGEFQLGRQTLSAEVMVFMVSLHHHLLDFQGLVRSRLPGDTPKLPYGGLTCLHVAQVLVLRESAMPLAQ